MTTKRTAATQISVPASTLPRILVELNTRIGRRADRALTIQADAILAKLERGWPTADDMIAFHVASPAAQQMLYILQELPDATIGAHQGAIDAAIAAVSALAGEVYDVDRPSTGI